MSAETSILKNCNTHIEWCQVECGKYTIQNISPTNQDIAITVNGGSVVIDEVLSPGEVYSLELGEDGIFDFSAILVNDNITYKDYFVDFCRLLACYQKLLATAYCPAGVNDDPNDMVKNKCEKCPPGTDADGCPHIPQEERDEARKTLEQLNGMIIGYMTMVTQFNLGFTGLQAGVEDDPLEITNLKMLMPKINSFIANCTTGDCDPDNNSKDKDCFKCL